MPEGHVLHRLAQDQQELVGDVVTASSPQGRFADGAGKIDGGRLALVEAYGKHLRHRYDTGAELHCHLGMQGKCGSASIPDGPAGTRSGSGWPIPASPGTSSLRPPAASSAPATGKPWSERWDDPLRTDADPDEVWRRLHTYRGALGAALLDQSVVAGVGNVLRAESLFATDRRNLPEQRARMVYKQPACRRCGTPVAVSVIGGRMAYVCPVCQPD